MLLTGARLVAPLVLVGCMLLTGARLVAPSVLVGCMLLLTRTVPVIAVVPTFEGRVIFADTVERKNKPKKNMTSWSSLVPRPLPDFILQLWRKVGRRPGTIICHGPEMVHVGLGLYDSV